MNKREKIIPKKFPAWIDSAMFFPAAGQQARPICKWEDESFLWNNDKRR